MLARITLPLVILCFASQVGLADDRSTSAELMKSGAMALAEGRADEAIEILTRALKEGPSKKDLWRVYMNRSLAYGRKDNVEAALGDLDASLQSDPPESAAEKILLLRGVLRIRACKLQPGLDDLNKAVEMNPGDPEALVAQGGVLLKRFGNYRQAMDNFDRALNAARQLRTEQGAKSRDYVLWKRAEALISVEQYRDALEDLETVFKSPVQSGAPSGAWRERAKVELVHKDFSVAQSDCEQALTLDPEDSPARAVLGQIAWCQGRTKAARDIFQSLSNCVYRAQLQFSEGKTDTALRQLADSLPKEQCEPLEMVQTYGMFLHALGETNQAVGYLRRAVRESGVPNLSWAVLFVATKQHQQEAAIRREVLSRLAAFPQNMWANALIRLATGERALGDVLIHTRTEEEGTGTQHAGEAYYVSGELNLLKGNNKSAAEDFASCVKRAARCSPAHILATERLRQLGNEPSRN